MLSAVPWLSMEKLLVNPLTQPLPFMIGDFNVETDTRVVICVLSKPLPTSLEIGRGKLRVHHRGQVQSCFLCGEEGHFARECEKRQKRDDQKSEKTPDTRNGSGQGVVNKLVYLRLPGSGQRRPSTSAVRNLQILPRPRLLMASRNCRGLQLPLQLLTREQTRHVQKL